MNERDFIQGVRERMGGATREEARQAIEAVLSCLASRVTAVDREPLLEQLPARFRSVLEQPAFEPELTLDTLYARVSEREGVPIGFAMEHVHAVCRALLERLDAQARTQLAVNLWAELLRPSVGDRRIAPPTRPKTHAPQTLASGRAGSTRPLSEAREVEAAHRDSVARSPNPRADRKLSSGGRFDTLASGRRH